jgi:hypothetical protein
MLQGQPEILPDTDTRVVDNYRVLSLNIFRTPHVRESLVLRLIGEPRMLQLGTDDLAVCPGLKIKKANLIGIFEIGIVYFVAAALLNLGVDLLLGLGQSSTDDRLFAVGRAVLPS